MGKYDTSSDTLTKITPSLLNTKQNFISGVLVGSKIYMAPMHRNDVGVYDTETDTMTSISVASESTPLNMFPGIAAIGIEGVDVSQPGVGKTLLPSMSPTNSNPIVQKTVIPSTVTPWRIYGKDKVYGDTVAVGDKIICLSLGKTDTGIGVYDTATNAFTKKDILLDQGESWLMTLAALCRLRRSRCILPGPRPVIYNATDAFTEIDVDAPAVHAYAGCAVYGDNVYFTPSKSDIIRAAARQGD